MEGETNSGKKGKEDERRDQTVKKLEGIRQSIMDAWMGE